MTSLRFPWLSRVLLSVVLTLAVIAFSGCSSLSPVEVRTTDVTAERPPEKPALPNPRPIDTSPIEWKVLTPDRLPKKDGWVYYGLTPEQYETLSRNTAEMLRYIKEAKWRLDYYRGEKQLGEKAE